MKVPRTVRNTIISVFALIILFIGSGVAYVYTTGKETGKTASQPASESPKQSFELPKPKKPSPDAIPGASIQSLITPVKAGTNSSITVKTLAGSNCEISVIYNDMPAKDSGLSPKTSDDYGIVAWSWKIASTASAGTWPVKVTCVYNSRSAVVIGDLEVTR